uniref:Uncharacterized protein n=1 Tax=Megaselia scalaris TaxID=36166 RepID=T1GF96_MEGSC
HKRKVYILQAGFENNSQTVSQGKFSFYADKDNFLIAFFCCCIPLIHFQRLEEADGICLNVRRYKRKRKEENYRREIEWEASNLMEMGFIARDARVVGDERPFLQCAALSCRFSHIAAE